MLARVSVPSILKLRSSPSYTALMANKHITTNRTGGIGKNFDWSKGKRVAGPIITKGQVTQFKREAHWLAERIEKGKPSANAKTSGPVKTYSADELKTYADRNGFGYRS